MVERRVRVRFHGILRGQGHQTTCTVSATRVSLPGTGVEAYTQYRIESVSKPLPEGTYELVANGEVTRVRYQNGHWLAAMTG